MNQSLFVNGGCDPFQGRQVAMPLVRLATAEMTIDAPRIPLLLFLFVPAIAGMFSVPVAFLDLLKGALRRFAFQLLRLLTFTVAHFFFLLVTIDFAVQFFDANAFKTGFQAGQASKKSGQLMQLLLYHRVMGPISPLLPSDQVRFPQRFQVLGNGCFRYSQMFCQGAHAEVMGQQQLDQLEPRLIRQGFENLYRFHHHSSGICIHYALSN